jgi:acyl carrier protein
MRPTDIERETRDFLISTFLSGRSEQLRNDDVLLGNVIDSMGVLELVGFLERTFAISVPDEDVVAENLGSINSITTYIVQRLPGNA